MKNITKVLFCIILFFLTSSLYSITNFGRVNDKIYRGGKLEKKEYKELRDMGVDTIISLEFFNAEDKSKCNINNIDCERFGIVLLTTDTGVDYSKFKEAFIYGINALNKGGILYIHCHGGSDRTSVLSALFKIRDRACIDKNYNYVNDYNYIDSTYDPEEMEREIREDWVTYDFHYKLYPRLKNKIIDWVYNVPNWVCK